MLQTRAGRAGAVVVASAAYLAAFFPLFPVFDLSTCILLVVPILLAGGLFGTVAGAVMGIAGALVTDVMLTAVGRGGPETYSQAVLGAVTFMAMGLVAGRLRDLSEKVRAQTHALVSERERLQRELAAREEYTSVVVHELRNPLIAIGATLRVIARAGTDAAAAQKLNAAASEATRALDLLDGLNDVSSLESGRMRSVLRPTDLNAIVRSAVESAGDLGNQVSLRASDLPVAVLGDERRLGQVIRNLVSNAAKYSPSGAPIEVTVGVGPDHRSAVVRVRDYGPGVPPNERERLFHKFARLSTAGGTTGSGLGLFISRGIMRDHNGDITAEWPAGGGTAFSVSLPLAPR